MGGRGRNNKTEFDDHDFDLAEAWWRLSMTDGEKKDERETKSLSGFRSTTLSIDICNSNSFFLSFFAWFFFSFFFERWLLTGDEIVIFIHLSLLEIRRGEKKAKEKKERDKSGWKMG